MSVFDKIKSLFIVEEESVQNQNNASQEPKNNTTTTTVDTPKPNTASTTTPTNSSGTITDKFTDVLLKALSDNNIEGFDYLEFRQGLLSLAKMPMDEATRFQAAFSMAQAMGATPQKLIETGNQYLKVLEGELNKFNEAVVNQSNTLIGSKQSEIKQLNEFIQQKSIQIKKLTEELQQHQQRIDVLNKELAESNSKVENTKNNFLATYKNVTDTIKSDISNIQKYLANK